MKPEDIKQLISAYFDGETSAEETKLAEQYIKENKEYARYYESLGGLSASLTRWQDEELSPDLEQKLISRLDERQEQKERTMERKFSLSLMTAGSLAAIVFLVVVVQSTYVQRMQNARLKNAADDIGDQFGVGNTSQIVLSRKSDSSVELKEGIKREVHAPTSVGSKTRGEAEKLNQPNTQQYEPYYLKTNYDVTAPSRAIGGSTAPAPTEQGKFMGAAKVVAPAPATEADRVSIVASAKSKNRRGFQEFSYDASHLGRDWDKKGEYALKPQQQGYSYSSNEKYYSDEAVRDVRRIDQNRGAWRQLNSDVVVWYPNGKPMYPYHSTQPQTEQYDPIFEHVFTNPTQNPLSTFSVDVDTASYSNIRRFLNSSQLPPVNAVRIEEMLNYFTYEYPEPSWGKPFSITTEVRQAPWNQHHDLVMIGIQGKTLSQREAKPSHLTFLIDVSGSMQSYNKLPLLKQGLTMLVNQLDKNDRVSIVTYSGAAQVVLRSVPGDQKGTILAAINRLRAGGSTYGESGIRLAYDIAQNVFIRNGNNRVILATDGDFNVGMSDDASLVRLIEQKRDRGVFLTVLGFGTGNLKDSKMEKLANHGNGNYAYIDTTEEAQKVLVNELGTNLFTIAKDVKIQVEFNPKNVKAYRLIGYENRTLAAQDFNNDRVDAGEVGAGHSITALYEVVPAGVSHGYNGGVDPLKYQRDNSRNYGGELMTMKLRYKDPDDSHSKLMTEAIKRKRSWFNQNPSNNFKKASAVAEFGMLLRSSPNRAYSSYNNVLMRLRDVSQWERNEEIRELMRLVEISKGLDHRSYPEPAPVYPYPYRYMNQYDTAPQPTKQFKGQK